MTNRRRAPEYILLRRYASGTRRYLKRGGNRRTHPQFGFQWSNKNAEAIEMQSVGGTDNAPDFGIHERTENQWTRAIDHALLIDRSEDSCGFFPAVNVG